MKTFVEAEWLRSHLSDPQLRIVDARSAPHGAPGAATASGADEYAAGHIPGAIHLDYADHLADPATPYAARVAPPDLFARVLGERGIGDQHTIVAYDSGTTPYAARFLWMCRYYGHDDIHILAGGLGAWIAAGGALTQDVPSFDPAVFTPRTRKELRASRDEVLSVATGGRGSQLLETQRDATYALRDRDIPNAQRLSASLLLEDERGGRLADSSKINAALSALGLDRSKRTITSCGSGVGASGAYLALVENGFTDVAVYDGSWMEWSHDGMPTVPKSTSKS
jgi:thiosulfate/3-mercaptopyruvate sulfurtransferase